MHEDRFSGSHLRCQIEGVGLPSDGDYGCSGRSREGDDEAAEKADPNHGHRLAEALFLLDHLKDIFPPSKSAKDIHCASERLTGKGTAMKTIRNGYSGARRADIELGVRVSA